MQRLRLGLHERLADAFSRYARAEQQVERYRDHVLPDSRETLDLVAAGYQQGEFGYLSLLTARPLSSRATWLISSPCWS